MRATISLLALLALGAAQASALRCPMGSASGAEVASEEPTSSDHPASHHQHGGTHPEGDAPDTPADPTPAGDVDCTQLMSCGVVAAPAIVVASLDVGDLLDELESRPSPSNQSIFLDIRIPPPRRI